VLEHSYTTLRSSGGDYRFADLTLYGQGFLLDARLDASTGVVKLSGILYGMAGGPMGDATFPAP
jgi:hypothetical protein